MGTMKPQFALSLSSDGISLLTRGTDGWHGLGTVGFGGDTMEADLAALRQRGAELTGTPATDPLPVKLIIPEDQIRYLALDTGPLPLGSRRDAAATALEGATPYAVSELSFDIAAHGVTTHVAAVALETLQEAETFARAQGFAPLCYLATPEESAFVGEAFLGTPPGTDADVTAALKADRLPVRDLGPLPVKAPTLPTAPTRLRPTLKPPSPLDWMCKSTRTAHLLKTPRQWVSAAAAQPPPRLMPRRIRSNQQRNQRWTAQRLKTPLPRSNRGPCRRSPRRKRAHSCSGTTRQPALCACDVRANQSA